MPGRRVRGAGFACTAWLAAATALAQPQPPATPYGASLYRDGDAGSGYRPYRPVLPDAARPVHTLQQLVSAHEAIAGPYSPELLATLSELGAAQFGRGDYRDAGLTWGRAIHLVRINDGLESAAQITLLQQAGEASLASGRLDEADARQRQVYALARKHFDPADPEMQQAASRYADWLRSAYLAGIDRERYHRLVAIFDLYDELGAALDATQGPDSLAQLPYLRGRLVAAYLLSLYRGESPGGAVEAGAAAGEGKLDLIRFLELKRDAFREGERTAQRIQAILSADAQSSPRERAEATLALADWYQWHRRYAQSLPLYQAAWELAGEDAHAWRAHAFAEPVELPPGVVFQPGSLRAEGSKDTMLSLRLDVSRQGRVESIAWMPGAPVPEPLIETRARALLSGLRLRPRLADGEPVDTRGLERSYRMRHLNGAAPP